MHTGFCWGDLTEGDHLENLGVFGSIMLKGMLKTWDGGIDWIDVAQNRDRWQDFVKAVMNLRVPLNAGDFLSCGGPVSFPGRTLFHGVISLLVCYIYYKNQSVNAV